METYQPVDSDILVQARKALMTHQYLLNAPAISIAIARRGKLLWVSASGWADIASLLPVAPKHFFRIGSTSKAITATVFARFIDRDFLYLDQTVGKTLFPLPNSNWAPIRLRDLASHTSGLPHYGNNSDLGGLFSSMGLNKYYVDIDETLTAFDSARLLSSPGASFNYSSYGTNVLAAIMQDVSRKDFSVLLQEYITKPLGLISPIPDKPHEDRVEFYQLNDEKVRPWRKVDLSLKLAGGGLMARPQDLALLGNAWLNNEFVKVETREMFWQKQPLTNGEFNDQDYAIGWRWDNVRKIAHHGGVSKGAMSWLAIHPESELSIAISINTVVDEFWRFAQVQDVFLELFKEYDGSITNTLIANSDGTLIIKDGKAN
jgi:CubicO group peptidase (beta-lactamase class C family)